MFFFFLNNHEYKICCILRDIIFKYRFFKNIKIMIHCDKKKLYKKKTNLVVGG
jgi:hypothetical protein